MASKLLQQKHIDFATQQFDIWEETKGYSPGPSHLFRLICEKFSGFAEAAHGDRDEILKELKEAVEKTGRTLDID